MRELRVGLLRAVVVLAMASCAESAPPMRAVAMTATREVVVGQGGDGPGDRLLVKSARLEIERSDPEAGITAASEVAKKLGGWVQRSSAEGATLMVPAAQLDTCVQELSHLGEVTAKSVSGEDITEEHHDLRLQLANYEKERERYLDLLARAANVAEATTVEKEVERVTTEIERLQGRLQFLDQGVTYSSVETLFSRPVRPGPVGWIFYGLFVGVKWLFVWT